MESSAPKRRKTSPTTSVPVDAPGTTHARSTTPTASPSTRSGSRPSFASPTKASLAKHYPNILERRRTRPGNPERGAARGDDDESVSAAIDAQLESEHEAASPAQAAAGRQDDTRTRSQDALDTMRSPIRRIGGGMAAQPRRTPSKPQPRPLPPPGPENDEEILNPFAGRSLRRSPSRGPAVPPVVEEPELPPTPEHPDPVVSTPPSGIHNTPSKRPHRSKAVASIIRSSPSKAPPSKPVVARRGADGQAIEMEPFTFTAEKAQPAEPLPSEIRKVKALDPDADKKKQRDALLAEVDGLEADLEVARAEVESAQQPRDEFADEAASTDKLLGILRRHDMLPSDEKVEPEPSARWLDAIKDIISFLPFGGPPSALPSLFTASTPAEDDAPLLSHHPTEMGVEEELPYLQAFVPLSFSSTISVLPRQPAAGGPLLRKHTIEIASTSPPGLFAATVEMTVDTDTLAIADLGVPRLDPAAKAELMPFLKKILDPEARTTRLVESNLLLRNVSVLTWAMSEWVRVAVRRAKFWCALDQQLGTEEALLEAAAAVRRRTRRKRRRGSVDPATEAEGEGTAEGGPKGRLVAKDLLPHMGRTAMDLVVPAAGSGAGGSDLRVQWRIVFDATGEAQSRLGVTVGLPTKWHKQDSRARLSNVPEVFEKLLEGGKEPLAAVKVVAALLAGDAAA